MFKWFNKLRQIVRGYDADRLRMVRAMEQLEAIVRERTDIAVDVDYRGMASIILVGRYRNADFVQTYTLSERDLPGLIDRLRDMERYGQVRRADGPPEFSAVVKHALKNGR